MHFIYFFYNTYGGMDRMDDTYTPLHMFLPYLDQNLKIQERKKFYFM